jgi:putative transposase
MWSREDRLRLVDRNDPEMPLVRQAELLSLNRSGLYYRAKAPSLEEVQIKHCIDQIYTDHPYYGSRRITVVLRRDHEIEVNRKRVQAYMREMAIAGVCPGPNLSKRNLEHQIYPYLLRHVRPSRPNQVWGIDITYVRLKRAWMYLVAVIDWYSRYVLSWALDGTLEMAFVLEAVDAAMAKGPPEIWNSDQGSHFTSPLYTDRLKAAGVAISMDGKGRALDNIFTERLWRTIKYEEVYLHEYATPREARIGIGRYLRFYNESRPHQALNYRAPAVVHGVPQS